MHWGSYYIEYALGILHVYNLPWGVFDILAHWEVLIAFTSRILNLVRGIKAYVYAINKCTIHFIIKEPMCVSNRNTTKRTFTKTSIYQDFFSYNGHPVAPLLKHPLQIVEVAAEVFFHNFIKSCNTVNLHYNIFSL